MVTLNRPINLISKLNPTVFKLLNKDVFGTVEQPLGSVQGAVTRILSPEYQEMLKVLMPGLIVTNTDDPTWHKKVKNYWDSFGIKVPIGGKTLETGFNFNFTDLSREKNIKAIVALAAKDAKKTVIDSDDSLKNYVMSSAIVENERFKYASPINPEQYLLWIFCLGHRKVAKQAESINNSTNIEFILIDPREIEDTRRAQHTVSIEATKKYLEILADRSKVRDILFVKGINASSLDDVDADSKLKTMVDSNPKEFLKIANDSITTIKAKIERYCVNGILKRLSNTSIIVDGNDAGIVIGNTTDEAVAYFSSEAADRVAKVNEFKTRYSILQKV
jgi:hypothetical protein